jgi:hypothetical protein
VTHGFSSYFPEPRSPCSPVSHTPTVLLRANTRAHISPHSPRRFILDSGTVGLEYLGSLVNSYLPGLRSIPRARRFLLDPQARRALTITRSGSGADLPGVRHTMTGSDDDAPAARGPPLRTRARLPEGRESSRACRPADFPAPSSFTGCTVRCHEDVPRHIHGLFQALGTLFVVSARTNKRSILSSTVGF